MARPNFFIVGAPKCGTTSLHGYLGEHPQVYMGPWKEPHFFCKDLRWRIPGWGIDQLDVYLAQYDAATDESQLGEGSTWYLYSKVAAEEIKRFNPEAKIICMFRKPVDMICSMYHQNIANGNEDILDLNDALDAEVDRMQGRRIRDGVPWPFDLRYLDAVRYAQQLQRYFDQFDRDRIHIIIFDDFAADTRGCFARACEFLDIDPTFQPVWQTWNPKKTVRNVGVRRWVMAHPRMARFLHERVPKQFRKIAGDGLSLVTPTPNEKVVSPAARQRICQAIAPEVDRLSQMIGRDLSHWLDPG